MGRYQSWPEGGYGCLPLYDKTNYCTIFRLGEKNSVWSVNVVKNFTLYGVLKIACVMNQHVCLMRLCRVGVLSLLPACLKLLYYVIEGRGRIHYNFKDESNPAEKCIGGFICNAIKTICIFIAQDIECLRYHSWHIKERKKENQCPCDCNLKITPTA